MILFFPPLFFFWLFGPVDAREAVSLVLAMSPSVFYMCVCCIFSRSHFVSFVSVWSIKNVRDEHSKHVSRWRHGYAYQTTYAPLVDAQRASSQYACTYRHLLVFSLPLCVSLVSLSLTMIMIVKPPSLLSAGCRALLRQRYNGLAHLSAFPLFRQSPCSSTTAIQRFGPLVCLPPCTQVNGVKRGGLVVTRVI